jgi:opacity protein-like surface antigen
MTKILLALALVVALPISAFAAGAAAPAAAGGGNPTGTDGCGLGWQVTKDKTMLGTTTRGTTNGFVPPTFGMTSGTIGCDQHSIAQNEHDSAAYAYNNFDSLKSEMAAGQGEILSGFAASLGCDAQTLGSMTKAQYKTLVNEKTSAIDMYMGVKSLVAQQGCGA